MEDDTKKKARRGAERGAARGMNDGETSAGAESPGADADVPDELAAMSVADLRKSLVSERERAEANLRQWQRAAADYQNLKRRSEHERGEAARFAQLALVINLLPVYDDFDRAIATVDAHLAGLTWVQGISAIHRKFTGVLQAMDVYEIDAEGQEFDPSRHEAVGQAAGEDNKVVHVVQKGYRLGDRVIRPSMVIVGNGSAGPD